MNILKDFINGINCIGGGGIIRYMRIYFPLRFEHVIHNLHIHINDECITITASNEDDESKVCSFKTGGVPHLEFHLAHLEYSIISVTNESEKKKYSFLFKDIKRCYTFNFYNEKTPSFITIEKSTIITINLLNMIMHLDLERMIVNQLNHNNIQSFGLKESHIHTITNGYIDHINVRNSIIQYSSRNVRYGSVLLRQANKKSHSSFINDPRFIGISENFQATVYQGVNNLELTSLEYTSNMKTFMISESI